MNDSQRERAESTSILNMTQTLVIYDEVDEATVYLFIYAVILSLTKFFIEYIVPHAFSPWPC